MKKKSKDRKLNGWLVSVLGILIFGICFLFARVFLSHEPEKAFARNTLGKQPISAIAQYRGYVYDRKLRPLAASVVSYSVYAHPLEIKNPAETVSLLASCININSQNLVKALGSDAAFVWVARCIKSPDAEKIRNLNLKGIYFARENARVYPYSTLASQTLGFTDQSGHGVDGLESAYETVLVANTVPVKDQHGILSVSFPGRPVEPEVQKANNLVLTLDIDIQTLAEKQLALLAGDLKGKSGTMIVMDIKTGAILALASYPGYDLNTFWESDATRRKNTAITDQHEMGSLINFFETVARAEAEWAYSQNTVQSGDSIVPGQEDLKVADFYNTILRLGIGKKCSRDLPGEAKGSIPPLSRYTADTDALYRGRNIFITPLQLITAFSAIVNKGLITSPFIISRITDGPGKAAFETKPAGGVQACRKEVSDQIRTWLATSCRTWKLHNIIQFSTCNNLKPAVTFSTGEQALDKDPGVDYIRYLLTAVPVAKPEIAILTIVDGTAAGDVLSEDELNSRIKYITYESLRLSRNCSPAGRGIGLQHKSWDPQAGSSRPAKPFVPGETLFNFMPDLRGKTMREALCCLQKYNVSVVVNGTGLATSQSPAPGTRLGKMARCSIQFKPI